MPRGKKVVLVGDHNSAQKISLGEHLGNDLTDVEILTSNSASGVLEMTWQYRPHVVILISSLVQTGGAKSLPDLIKEASPSSRVIIVQAASKQGAGSA